MAEQAAPTSSVPVSPSSSIRTKPAAIVPTIAPDVLAAYSRPKELDRLAGSRERWRVRVGRVAPIRIVAGPRARSESPKRIRASDASGLSSRLSKAPA